MPSFIEDVNRYSLYGNRDINLGLDIKDKFTIHFDYINLPR